MLPAVSTSSDGVVLKLRLIHSYFEIPDGIPNNKAYSTIWHVRYSSINVDLSFKNVTIIRQRVAGGINGGQTFARVGIGQADGDAILTGP
jgi:hypothetical protein